MQTFRPQLISIKAQSGCYAGVNHLLYIHLFSLKYFDSGQKHIRFSKSLKNHLQFTCKFKISRNMSSKKSEGYSKFLGLSREI